MKAEYERLTRAFVAASPASPWAEEALNDLATGFIIDDEDERANAVFQETLERYPSGRFAERAAWRSGWWAYRQGRFRDAARIFDRGAASFPRSDYRPPWLYWSGRAAEQIGDLATAAARFTVAATDYYNSYYGRLALARLTPERVAAIKPTFQRVPATPAKPLPTAQRIGLLIATGLHREALGELQYAQRVWGDSPQLQATVAFVQQRLGNVRAGINAMKRAYPQYLAAGGEALPTADSASDLPARLLAAAAEVWRGARPRSVPARCARGSGVELRPDGRLAGQRRRPDAGAAVHRPGLRKGAWDCDPSQQPPAERS